MVADLRQPAFAQWQLALEQSSPLKTKCQLAAGGPMVRGGAGRPLRVGAKFRLFLPVMDKMFVRK